MGEKTTIESLISTSVDDDLDSLPLFNEGNMIKRISKQQIEGWNQTYHRQPFQKKQSTNRWRKQSTNPKRQCNIPQKFNSQQYSPPSLKTIKKQLNHYGNDNDSFQNTQAFKTMSYFQFKEEGKGFMLPKVNFKQQPKQDYVKGVKFTNFITHIKKTKPFTPLIQLPKNPKKETDHSRSKSLSLKVCTKSVSKDSKIPIISYPLDAGQPEQNDYLLKKNKLHAYMRKYQIDMV